MYIGQINYEKGDTVIHNGSPNQSKRNGWIGVVVRVKQASIVVDWVYDKEGREMHGYQGKRIIQEYGTSWIMHCMLKSDFSPAEIAAHRRLNRLPNAYKKGQESTIPLIRSADGKLSCLGSCDGFNQNVTNNQKEPTMEHKRFYLIIHADFEKSPKTYTPTISHGTYGDAQQEALRLSNQHKARFYVMQSLGFAEPPKQPSAMFVAI